MTSYDLLPFAPFTTREWFLVGIFLVTYAALLVVTIQNSRRKMQILRDRLDLSLIQIPEPSRQAEISYDVFFFKNKRQAHR